MASLAYWDGLWYLMHTDMDKDQLIVNCTIESGRSIFTTTIFCWERNNRFPRFPRKLSNLLPIGIDNDDIDYNVIW